MTVSRTYTFTVTITVDDEDADLLEKLDAKYEDGKIHKSVTRAVLNTTTFDGYQGLHRAILARAGQTYGKGHACDHIDRDNTNNRRSNLRVVTAAANNQNRSSSRGEQSSYVGVQWTVNGNTWRAACMGYAMGKHVLLAKSHQKKGWSDLDAAIWRDLEIRRLDLDIPRNFTDDVLENHIKHKENRYDNGKEIRKTTTERVGGHTKQGKAPVDAGRSR